MGEGEAGPACLASLSRHMQRLRRLQVSTRAGLSADAALKKERIFFKQATEYERQFRKWLTPSLDRVQLRLVEVDEQLKSSGSPEQALVRQLFTAVARESTRLGL